MMVPVQYKNPSDQAVLLQNYQTSLPSQPYQTYILHTISTDLSYTTIAHTLKKIQSIHPNRTMKAFIIASYGICLITSTFAAPLGEEDALSAANILGKRADEIKIVNGAPTADPICQGSAVKGSDIRLALSQGVRWKIDEIENSKSSTSLSFTRDISSL